MKNPTGTTHTIEELEERIERLSSALIARAARQALSDTQWNGDRAIELLVAQSRDDEDLYVAAVSTMDAVWDAHPELEAPFARITASLIQGRQPSKQLMRGVIDDDITKTLQARFRLALNDLPDLEGRPNT